MVDDQVVLEGEHVRLEPMRQEHAGPLAAVGLDPSLWQWTTFVVHTLEEMEEYVARTIAARGAGAELPYVTIDRASGRVVGSTRYMNIDRANRRVEIGSTWVTPEFQRTPVNTEAKYLMFRHAFETLRCIRVELKTDSLNQRSRAAIERVGAREEGTFRNHMIVWNGRLRHSVYYSVIEEEWPRVKAMLEDRLKS